MKKSVERMNFSHFSTLDFVKFNDFCRPRKEVFVFRNYFPNFPTKWERRIKYSGRQMSNHIWAGLPLQSFICTSFF